MIESQEIEVKLNWQFAFFMMIIAFIVRFLFVFTLESDQFYFDDSLQWSQMAVNLLSGKGFVIDTAPTAYRMPLYPLFLAGIYYLFGHANLFAVRIVQAALSAYTCLLIYITAVSVFSEEEKAERIGKISMAVSCFYPFFIYYSGAVLTETLYIFLLVAFIFFMSKHKYVLASLMFGAAVMCRSELSAFIVFIIAGLFFTLRSKEAVLITATMVALMFAAMLPWTARNYLVFNKFVPLSTMGGWTFWEGNNPQNLTGGPSHYFPDTSGMDEVQRDKYLRTEALKVIKDDPGRFTKLCWSKFRRFWNFKLNTDDPRYASKRNDLISMFSYGPVLLLSITGLMLSFHNRKKLVFIYFLIAFVMLVNLAFVSSLRYRLPIEPYLIMFAGYTLASLGRRKT